MKRMIAIVFVLALTLCLIACSAKLTTVRPGDVYLEIVRLSDGETVSMPNDASLAERAEVLVFQLEEPYAENGKCGGPEVHIYHVTLVRHMSDETEMECFINMDGSVCKDGARYIADSAASDPVNVADWDAYFEDALAVLTGSSDPIGGESSQGPDIVTCKGDPMDMPAGVELDIAYPVAEADGWSYYIGEAAYDGMISEMVWRENANGDAEWLMNIDNTGMTGALRHMAYYDGGCEESDGRFLYFTISDGSNYHRSLWVFDTETLYFNMMYDAPCSNMVSLLDPSADYEDMGWIVYDHYLIPIELEKAEEYTGGIIDLDEYYAVLGDELFYGIGDFGTHKFVQLSAPGGNAITIESVIAEPETSAGDVRSAHQIDVSTLKFD